MHQRLLQGHAPLTERFAQDIVDTALTGLGYTPNCRVARRSR